LQLCLHLLSCGGHFFLNIDLKHLHLWLVLLNKFVFLTAPEQLLGQLVNLVLFDPVFALSLA
jgi:hypothetical protein